MSIIMRQPHRATRLLDGYATAVCPSGAVPKTLAKLVEAAWCRQSGQKAQADRGRRARQCKKPRARPRPPPPTASPPQEEAGKKRAHADDAKERRPSPPAKRRDYGESWAGDDHGEWKDAMNDVFGEGVWRLTQEHGSGLVLVLDDDNEPAGGPRAASAPRGACTSGSMRYNEVCMRQVLYCPDVIIIICCYTLLQASYYRLCSLIFLKNLNIIDGQRLNVSLTVKNGHKMAL